MLIRSCTATWKRQWTWTMNEGIRTMKRGKIYFLLATSRDEDAHHFRQGQTKEDIHHFFPSEAQAEKIGYDFCAHCFGKGRSKK